MAKSKEKVLEGEIVPKNINVGGRPTVFKDEYRQKMLELMKDGYYGERLYAELGIARTTWYRWLQDNEKLKEDYEYGKCLAQAWWEELGLHIMLGKVKNSNATVWMANMNNKFKWSRKEGGDSEKGTQINIENMQVLQNLQHLSDDELNSKIQGSLEKLGLGELKDDQNESND